MCVSVTHNMHTNKKTIDIICYVALVDRVYYVRVCVSVFMFMLMVWITYSILQMHVK